MDEEALWGVAEVSGFLGVPAKTIYNWRSSGYGPPARRVGRYLRYDPADVRAWFRELKELDRAE